MPFTLLKSPQGLLLLRSASFTARSSPASKQFSFCPISIISSFSHFCVPFSSPSPLATPGKRHQFQGGVPLELGELRLGKKLFALGPPPVQRPRSPRVPAARKLAGREGEVPVFIQFAEEGIPKACRGLWLR